MSDETQEAEAQADAADIGTAIDDAAQAVAVTTRELGELAGGNASGDPMGLDQLLDVPVEVTVELGSTRMTLGELVKLAPGSLVELDREAHEPADILVNGKIVARGEIVTVGESYAVRIARVEG